MKRLISLLVLSAACSAQSDSFTQEHGRGLDQNHPGVRLVIKTADGRSSFHLSDVMRFKLIFTSQERHVFTIDTAVGGNAAATTTDFIIEGPGLSVPLHSRPIDPRGIVCCDSRRQYLGRSPVSIPDQCVSLKRLASFGNGLELSPLRRWELQPGEYVIFAQTRNVIRGWPKSPHDAYHSVSDMVVTSSNILHVTIVPDSR